MTQREYEAMIMMLREEQDAELAIIDQRMRDNAELKSKQVELLSAVKTTIASLHAEKVAIEQTKNEIVRRYKMKRAELRNERNNSIEPKEISSTIAWVLHNAVESALKEALAPIGGDIDIERVKCNYHYDDAGHISFDIQIPRKE